MQVNRNHNKETGLKSNICISTEIKTFWNKPDGHFLEDTLFFDQQ